jgi:predicted AlkP superfamily pyrophosphatase or phosphodiesterase
MKTQKNSIRLFFLIDALGWEYIKNRGFLRELLPYQSSLETILGFSCAAIPSILTGKYPSGHGRWNLFYYSPQTSPFKWTKILHFLPESILNTRYTRKGINVVSKRLSGYKGYFSSYGVPAKILPYFDLCEKNNIYEPRSFLNLDNIFDLLGKRGISYRTYTYHSHADEEALNEILKEITNQPKSVYFVYLSEFDAFLHRFCKHPDRVGEKLDWYEKRLKEIVVTAEKSFGSVRSFVFSDHGMTPTKSTHNLLGLLQQLKSSVPKDFIYTLDSTMARFWFLNESSRGEVTHLLSGQTFGRVLKDEDLRAHGIKFSDNGYGDLIFLMNPGEIIFPSFMGNIPFEGMHGFHPIDAYSYGSFLTNCSDIASPQKITDIYQLFSQEIDRIEKG